MEGDEGIEILQRMRILQDDVAAAMKVDGSSNWSQNGPNGIGYNEYSFHSVFVFV